jgi:hypothetical protein
MSRRIGHGNRVRTECPVGRGRRAQQSPHQSAPLTIFRTPSPCPRRSCGAVYLERGVWLRVGLLCGHGALPCGRPRLRPAHRPLAAARPNRRRQWRPEPVSVCRHQGFPCLQEGALSVSPWLEIRMKTPNSPHVMRVQPSRKRLRANPADTVSRTIGSESRG